MSTPVIKAITTRIRLRYGSCENAARAAGVSKSVWSDYENADKPETSIPFHRLLAVANAAERRDFAALLIDERCTEGLDLLNESCEASEAVLGLQGVIRAAGQDGHYCETDKRVIRAKALETRGEVDDVLRAVS